MGQPDFLGVLMPLYFPPAIRTLGRNHETPKVLGLAALGGFFYLTSQEK
jgi:hypothetical protein